MKRPGTANSRDSRCEDQRELRDDEKPHGVDRICITPFAGVGGKCKGILWTPSYSLVRLGRKPFLSKIILKREEEE